MIDRDISKLVPAFRARVELLLERMRARGFDAMVWETYRSRGRAAQLADAGRGVKDSMHTLGLAVDIVSESKKWGPGEDFWAALGEEAEALSLTWGGRWPTRPDKPHVQAIPVSAQGNARKLAARELDAFSSKYMAPLPERIA